MRHILPYALVFLCGAIAPRSFAANTVIARSSGYIFRPFATSLPMTAVWETKSALDNEQMSTYIAENQDGAGDNDPEYCTVLEFLTECEYASNVGVFVTDTHGSNVDSCIVVEVYASETARTNAYNAYSQYLHEGAYSNWEIKKTIEYPAPYYGIAVHPRAIASRQTGYQDALVIVSGCGVLNSMDAAWPGSACRVGRDSAPGMQGLDVTGLLSRMCGAADKTLRSVSTAIAGGSGYGPLTTAQMTSSSDGDITLAPVVKSWSGPATINYELVSYDIVFDSKMADTDHVAEYGGGEGKFDVWWQEWSDDHTELHVEISAYKSGPCELWITPRAVSADGDKALDGNTEPSFTDGFFPNGDRYEIQLTSNFEQDPPGAMYAGAYAFPSGDSTVVSWIADPEWSTTRYEVVASPNNTVLRTIPPSGSRDRPHYYETRVQNPGGHPVYVSNVDSSGVRHWATGPLQTAPPPMRLEAMRQLNTTVASWPSYNDRDDVPMRSGGEGTPSRPLSSITPDFIFYSSRQDFLDLAAPISDWWFQNYRLLTTTVLGGATASACRESLRPFYERSIIDGKVPQVVILGEANQSDHPEWNIVGTHYFPQNDENACTFGCASDNWMVDFDEDGVPDLPWTRVVANSTTELGSCIETALDWYHGDDLLAQRALVLGGNQRWYPPDCVEDALYTETLASVAAQLQSHGVAAIQMNDGTYGCDASYESRQAAILPVFNSGIGIREIAGTGVYTTRSMWPGWFIQKQSAPHFEMSLITRPQRLVCILPGCDISDIDRNNSVAYPSLAKAFLANTTSGASAVALIGHMRFGHAPYHPQLLKRIMDWRFNGATWTLQQAHWLALRDVAMGGELARAYVSVAGSLGWPVRLAGQPPPTVPGGGGGGGGCPIVDVWRGGSWQEGNSVLSGCAYRGCLAETVDCIEIALDPTGGSPLLELRLRESEEGEETSLNQCQLRVLDYSAAEWRELTKCGRAIAVSHTVGCSQAWVQDASFDPACLRAQDRDSLRILRGDRLMVVFPDSGSTSASGWVRIVGKCKATVAPGAEVDGGLRVLGGGQREYLFPRKNWQALVCDSINVVRGDSRPDTVIVESGEMHWIDAVQLLVGLPSNTGWRNIPLRTAVHSSIGDVRSRLSNADSNTVLIRNGESVNLTFYCGSVPVGEVRRAVFEPAGRYGPANSYRGTADLVTWSPRIWISPNPCSHDALIVLEGVPERTADVQAEVFAVDGRRVRSIGNWAAGSTFPCYRWDTRDDAGRRVPGGIYFVRLRHGSRVLTSKLVVLR